MKKIVVEMLNGNVYETYTDYFITVADITKELNNDNTKYMSIGEFVFIKAQVWTIEILEVEERQKEELDKVKQEKEELAAVLERWSDK